MTLEILYFTMYLLSSVFIILSLIFLIKYKQFQPDQLSKSTDVYLFGLVFLFLYTFIIFLDSGKFIIGNLFPSFLHNYVVYVNYLMTISNLTFILLMSICYLTAVLIMKETNV
ncbi:hypothetical protein J4449_01735 [Candidatus Woesearchaeota archaeon]|nr:hypothetical protein [Candidatus Woesearchaeota archaeon]